jgi:hypothetical protein
MYEFVFQELRAFNNLLSISLVALFAVFYSLSIAWGYEDAKERGKPPIAVAALIALLSWPVSLLVWYVFRPRAKD